MFFDSFQKCFLKKQKSQNKFGSGNDKKNRQITRLEHVFFSVLLPERLAFALHLRHPFEDFSGALSVHSLTHRGHLRALLLRRHSLFLRTSFSISVFNRNIITHNLTECKSFFNKSGISSDFCQS